MVVAGDSAGGGVAAVISLMAKDHGIRMPHAQMLFYPCTDQRMLTASIKQFTNTPICNSKAVAKYYKLTMDSNYTGERGYVSPMEADLLEGMPSTYLETAEFDCLRDEGIALDQGDGFHDH